MDGYGNILYQKPEERIADLKNECMERKNQVIDKAMVDELIERIERLCLGASR